MTLTPQSVRLLEEMLKDPTGAHYGFALMKAAGLKSGSLYPILARLEKAEWVTSEWEMIDPTVAGRPARRLYRLTGVGAQAARAQLAERPKVRGHRNLVVS